MHLGTLPLSNNKIVLHTYNPLTTVSNVTQHPFKILVIISLTHSVVSLAEDKEPGQIYRTVKKNS